MAQLLFLAAVAIIGYYGYRAFVREAGKVSARVRRHENESRNRAVGTLIKDPKTGEYRPVKEDD